MMKDWARGLRRWNSSRVSGPSLTRECSTSRSFSPEKSPVPVSSSHTITPSDQMSEAGP